MASASAGNFNAAALDVHQVPQGDQGFVSPAQFQQLPGQGLPQPAIAAMQGGVPASMPGQHVTPGNALPPDHIGTYAAEQPQLPMQIPQQIPGQLSSSRPSQLHSAGQDLGGAGRRAPDVSSNALPLSRQPPAQAPSAHAALSFEDAAQTMLTDIAQVAVFDQQGTLLFSNFQVSY